MDKSTITLVGDSDGSVDESSRSGSSSLRHIQGGESTSEEMCLHFFNYYPRIPSLYMCLSIISPQAWTAFVNDSAFVLWIEMSEGEGETRRFSDHLDSPPARRLSVSG